MKRWLNPIAIALMAASALAMIAADGFAGEPSRPFAPTAQKFFLDFDLLAPADLSCDASGPGVRVHRSRDLVGKPVLRVTGNAAGAEITCSRPDGSRFTTAANRLQFYNSAEPVRATVTFQPGRDAMTAVLRRGERIVEVAHGAFVRVP
ncbi:hypothetical protein [Paracoccus sp. (in: a-proteobacteria)]|uniref:hypothetical protein n=1 Tax=Paracoccus sp. TaxID=267 RepID=UPI0032209188